jgi:hypothetical protein
MKYLSEKRYDLKKITILFNLVVLNALVYAQNPISFGQPWEKDGVSLNLTQIDIRSSDGEPAAVRAWFYFFNASGQRVLVDINYDMIYLNDSFGNKYVDWEGGTASVWVDSGSSYSFSRYYSTNRQSKSRVPTRSGFVQVNVMKFSRIENVAWHYFINPALSPVQRPSVNTTFNIGQAIIGNNVSINLTNIDVRASNGEPAAVHAWYTIINNSDSRKLIEINFSHIYIIDGFNRQFIDWEGGGVVSVWLEPRQEYKFDRYYSEMSGVRSRMTSGSRYVLIKLNNILGINNAQWCYDIIY